MIVGQAAPSLRPFNPGEFLSTLVAQGPQLTSGVKGDWEGLYRRCVRSRCYCARYDVFRLFNPFMPTRVPP